MDAQFIYRQGSPQEQDALQQLGTLSYHQFSGMLAPADWQTMDRFLHNEKMWNKLVNHARIFVCEERIKLIGMAYLVPSGKEDASHIYESVGFKLDKDIDPIYGMRYFQYRLDIK